MTGETGTGKELVARAIHAKSAQSAREFLAVNLSAIPLDLVEVIPLGADRPSRVEFRLVAATNRELEKAVAEGRFRADLFYRLNVFRIEVPPLRDRRDDRRRACPMRPLRRSRGSLEPVALAARSTPSAGAVLRDAAEGFVNNAG